METTEVVSMTETGVDALLRDRDVHNNEEIKPIVLDIVRAVDLVVIKIGLAVAQEVGENQDLLVKRPDTPSELDHRGHRAETAEIVTVRMINSRVISQTDRQVAAHFLHLDIDKDHRMV